jgi:UDP-N-acetylmuramyl pentapeptide phosphotransferase/UDP-N-acetylglucosamine-1-phosphate transferase
MAGGWTATGPALWPTAIAGGLAAGLGALAATRAALAYLRRRRILDRPNHRSSHTIPTPRGGGLGVVPPILAVWAVLAATGTGTGWVWPAIVGAGLLMAASWIDDRHPLPALPRFLLQAAAVSGALLALPPQTLVLQGAVPPAIDRVLTGLVWLWFVNLYNFMDGIDGITGVETVSLGAGIAAVAALSGAATGLIPFALAAGAAGLAFLAWNWHPARLFLGDVGSIPLGFLLGDLLVHLAGAGQWAAALILPALYLADSSITLARRLMRGERIWQAHRQHFYQQPVKSGHRHDRVVLTVLGANLVLIVAGLTAAAGRPVAGLAVAAATVAGILRLFLRWGRSAP